MSDLSKETILNALEATAMNGEPPARLASLLDVGTADYLAYFKKEVIEGLIAGGGSTCRFYEGPYGSGKTHMLELLEEMALGEGMVVVRTDLSSDLRLEDLQAVTQYIMQNMKVDINGQMVRSLPNILDMWGESNPSESAKLTGTYLSHPGYKKAMAMALQPDQVSERGWLLLRAFLQGEKVTVTELKRAGIVGIKGPLNQRNAEIVLKTIIEGLNIIGIPGIMLLFDENERTLQPNRSKPTKKQLVAANLMRHLIDGCTNGNLPRTVVAFAILPGFLETTAVHYQALGQRLAMVRDINMSGAWRWPVLSLEEVNTAGEPEDFLEQAIHKLCTMVDQCGGNSFGLADKMKNAGMRVFQENAGVGYKRDLIKVLCALSLQYC